MDRGRKNSCVGGEDLKSRITTFHPAHSFLQASACLISLHYPRPRTRVLLSPCTAVLVNPRSSGIKYEAPSPYPRSLSFGTITHGSYLGITHSPSKLGSTHCGPDSRAVTGLSNLSAPCPHLRN